MPAPPEPSVDAEPAWPWWIAALGAALAVVWFGYGVSQRVAYPHELEWMEGALADHAWRVAHGLPLYCAPGPEHVPFLYAPLPFWLGAAGIVVGLDGVLALRLIAIVGTAGTAMLIGHWVRCECGRVLPGLVASGLFVAGYGWLAWWYDLARNDTLFVLLCVGAAYQLRHGGARRWLGAAALATAALLAKQSALMWLPAVGVGALCRDWRTGLRFGAATIVAMGLAIGALHLASDGWSTFFLFELPRHHGRVGEMKLGFWSQDAVWMLPLLALGVAGFVARCRGGDVRGALELAAFGSGALVTSWLSRLHVGGYDNVLMYGFSAACVLGPIAAARAGGAWRVPAAALVVAQFVLLGVRAWQRDPAATLLPSPAHRHAHEQMAAFVALQRGAVWIPGHGAISTRAGKGTGAHGQAIFDLLQPVLPLLPQLPGGAPDVLALTDGRGFAHSSPRVTAAVRAFVDGTVAALRERRFAAIVVDELGTGSFAVLFAVPLAGPDLRPDTADDPYVRLAGPLLGEPAAIAPLVGYQVHSPYALVRR